VAEGKGGGRGEMGGMRGKNVFGGRGRDSGGRGGEGGEATGCR
jgi:hypothetical protein